MSLKTCKVVEFQNFKIQLSNPGKSILVIESHGKLSFTSPKFLFFACLAKNNTLIMCPVIIGFLRILRRNTTVCSCVIARTKSEMKFVTG